MRNRNISKMNIKNINIKNTVIIIFLVSALFFPGCLQEIDLEHIDLLTGREFYRELVRHIDGAGQSIYIITYYITDYNNRRSPVKRIIDKLAAKQRAGVDVLVILEGSEEKDCPITQINKKVSKYLLRRGIYVTFDTKYKITHAKIAVIDREYVFCGSANLTTAAFYKNQECAVLLKSKKIAEECLKYFEKLEKYEL